MIKKQTLEKVAIRFSSCGTEKMIDFDLLETDYQEIITNFVLNKMLHHEIKKIKDDQKQTLEKNSMRFSSCGTETMEDYDLLQTN